MINHIKRLLSQFSEPSEGQKSQVDFNTALAALLVEVMRADGSVLDSELAATQKILIEQCEVDQTQAKNLISRAQQLVEEAIDLYLFVKPINDLTSDVERIDIVQLLWAVAYSDGQLESHEEHIIRRISGLLYVSHVDFISAKHRAQTS